MLMMCRGCHSIGATSRQLSGMCCNCAALHCTALHCPCPLHCPLPAHSPGCPALQVMDAFVQQMVPMRVAVHLAQKQARALRGSTPLTSSSAGAGIAAFVTGISAAAHAAAGTATAPAGAAAAAPTAPAAAAAVPSAPVGSEGQVAPSGSLSSQHRALAPAPAPHNHPPGSPPRHLATNQAGPSSSVAGTSAPAQPVVGAPAAPRGATVAGRSGAVVSVPRLSPLMTFSSTATEAHYLQQQGTSTRGQLLDGAFAAFLLFSLCCVHPHILRAGGAAAGAALLLPLLLAALPATWFHQRGYVDAREAAVATARLWRALLLAWQLLAGWGPWQQQVTSLLPSKSDSPAWQLLCWLFVISAAALAAALAAACVAGAAPRRSSARRPGLCLGAAAAGALAVVLAAAASAHASTSLWLAGQAVQQPWLLLVLMPLLGRTRLCLHLLLQTACLLPVLLATRFAASVQALGAAAAAAAGQQASGGASSSGSSSSSGTLLAAQWPEVLHLDASLEVALQLVLGFLLVSVLLHFQEVRSRYQYARRMRSA